jgi:lipocalin-like protein
MQNCLRSLGVATILVMATLFVAGPAMAGENQVVGTWRIVKAVVNAGTNTAFPYGPDPRGMLVFTSDMHFIAVLHDPRVPKFANDTRGKGTAEENAVAMAGTIGFYGTYTVDEKGEFSGNTVLGSTFPNWIGDVRTKDRLRMMVKSDTMSETFSRPDGLKVVIDWERVE